MGSLILKAAVLWCPDGEPYELVLHLVPGPIDVGVVDQTEELKAADLSLCDQVAHAYSAVCELSRINEEGW